MTTLFSVLKSTRSRSQVSKLTQMRPSRSSRRTWVSRNWVSVDWMSNLQRFSDALLTPDVIHRLSLRSTVSNIAKACFCTGHQAQVKLWLPDKLPRLSTAMSHKSSMVRKFLISSSVDLRKRSEICLLLQRPSSKKKEMIQICILSSLTRSMLFVVREEVGAIQVPMCTNLSSISFSPNLTASIALTIS